MSWFWRAVIPLLTGGVAFFALKLGVRPGLVAGIILATLFFVYPLAYGLAMLRRPLRNHCQECGYHLTGNVSGVCPECGTPVEKPEPNP